MEQKSKKKIIDCRVMQGAKYDVDHHLLVPKMIHPYQINIVPQLQEQQNKKKTMAQTYDTICIYCINPLLGGFMKQS